MGRDVVGHQSYPGDSPAAEVAPGWLPFRMPETKQTKALSLVHRVRERLSRFPLDITHREFPMRHTVTDASLAAASVWLSARL